MDPHLIVCSSISSPFILITDTQCLALVTGVFSSRRALGYVRRHLGKFPIWVLVARNTQIARFGPLKADLCFACENEGHGNDDWTLMLVHMLSSIASH